MQVTTGGSVGPVPDRADGEVCTIVIPHNIDAISSLRKEAARTGKTGEAGNTHRQNPFMKASFTRVQQPVALSSALADECYTVTLYIDKNTLKLDEVELDFLRDVGYHISPNMRP